MPVIKKIANKENAAEYQLWFFCPACNDYHAINHSWSFNEDYEKPSIEPSIRVRGHDERGDFECHLWITKGRIKYFPDCSHSMAGQRWIDLPEINEKFLE